MYLQQNIVFVISLFLILSMPLRAIAKFTAERYHSAHEIAEVTLDAFYSMFQECLSTEIPSQQFKIDDIKSFINYPSRTTVGSAPKMTSNRKFFANVVSTREFKDMLDKDVEAIRLNYIKKMKYCDNVVMNQNIVQDFYDREVDQTKM